MEVVESFKKMEQLKYLHITVSKAKLCLNWATVLAHVAGSVPALEEFSLAVSFPFRTLEFVEQYGQLYPARKLILSDLWFVLIYFSLISSFMIVLSSVKLIC